MTPAERDYDVDLVRSMREMAKWVSKRSGKIATTLNQGADRLEQLSSQATLETVIAATENQPASTPAHHETARKHGRGRTQADR